MKKGNTYTAAELDGYDSDTAEYPVKLHPSLTAKAKKHVGFALISGFFAAVMLGLATESPAARFVFTVLIVASPLQLFSFCWRFAKHHRMVCTAQLDPEVRDEVRKQGATDVGCSMFIFPVVVGIMAFMMLKHLGKVREAWVSYLSYEDAHVANPGVLRRPGGTRTWRLFQFHLTVFQTTWGMIALPLFGFEHRVSNLAMVFTFWELLFVPPLFVMLCASAFLVPAIDRVEEHRHDD